MNDTAKCSLCGEPMPAGEEMFNYHGFSGPCPKPPLPVNPESRAAEIEREIERASDSVVDHCECGAPRTAHKYWQDRVYEVYGERCPGILGGEYRFSKSRTEIQKRAARVSVLAKVLSHPTAQEDRAGAQQQ